MQKFFHLLKTQCKTRTLNVLFSEVQRNFATNFLIELKRNATPHYEAGFSFPVKTQFSFRNQIHKTQPKFRIFAILDGKDERNLRKKIGT